MKKILFIAPHRLNRAPSQRFRFEQYLPCLKENGYKCDFSYLVSEKDDKLFYAKGHYFKKFGLFIKYFFRRLNDVRKAGQYDFVFIQREMFFLGPAIFEYLLKLRKVKIIYDFDDSIWLPNVSDANKNLNWLKSFGKISNIISYADVVFAGNAYLKEFALKYNNNVFIIPTTIDTDTYKRIDRPEKETRICIGWSGSITTIQHFKYAENFLKLIYEKFGDSVLIKVIGDKTYANNDFNVEAKDWIKADELSELSSFDIGIMPLPNDKWANGKCGLKGLQYMALEIPTIMSPVGVNSEIIEHGKNGFLAKHDAEWVDIISTLIENADLRTQIGKNARKTVVEKYSLKAWENTYLEHFGNNKHKQSTV